MQGNPEGLIIGLEIMSGDFGERLRQQECIVGWVLSGHGDNSRRRCLNNFYLGGKENRSRLELSWEENQQPVELAGSFCGCLVSLFLMSVHAGLGSRVLYLSSSITLRETMKLCVPAGRCELLPVVS